MDDFAYKALDYRLKALESKLDGLQEGSFSTTIRKLRTDLDKLKSLGRLINNLKKFNEYDDIPIDPNSILLKCVPSNNEIGIEDKKLVILSQGQQLRKFLASVSHIESLTGILEKFKVTHAELSRARLKMDESPMKLLDKYNTQIYYEYCTGVQKCFHLLELDISHTYEMNLFLVEVQDRLQKISDKLSGDAPAAKSS
mgnify:CR=1 FL=1